MDVLLLSYSPESVLCAKGDDRVRNTMRLLIFRSESNTCKFNRCRVSLPGRITPNRMTEGENDIASHYLAFLVAFMTWPVGFEGEGKN
jgi:hypothetical protein